MRIYNVMDRQGMILLEVLMAVAILSFGLTAVVQSLMSGLRASALASEYLTATNALDQKMIEQYMIKTIRQGSETQGDLSGPYERLSYEIRIEPVHFTVFENIDLLMAHGEVRWQTGQSGRVITAALLMPGDKIP